MARSKQLFGSTSPRTGAAISPTYGQATKKNREGFPAFDRTPEEDTLSVLLTNTLGNTFYVDEKSLVDETVGVLKKMAEKDVEFLAKALVYARQKGLMKLAPVVGLTVLSAHDDDKKKTAFRQVFPHVVRIPDDLREFVLLCRSKKIRTGLGGVANTCVKNFLRHLSEYHGVKYGSAASKDITLRDIFRMAHPNPNEKSKSNCSDDKAHERLESGAQAELFSWVVNGCEAEKPIKLNPQVAALERVKRTDDEKEIIALVREHKLPWEVVIPSVGKMTTGIWKALLESMPYMALLRNLNTMERHKVFEDTKTVEAIAKRISDPEQVRRSKQFPFRFYNAYNSFDGNQTIREAIAEALEQSFANLPEIEGTVCVSNDISSSMGFTPMPKGKGHLCEIAGLFGAALFKKCKDAVLLPFDTSVHPDLGRVSRKDTIMSITRRIGIHQGGTDIGAPIRHLREKGKKVDVFIGLTDNEDWAGRGFLTAWEQYKREVNPKAKAFLVTLAPYRDYVAPKDYPDVWFVYGWSDAVLKYIPLVLSGGQDQVEDVRKIDLAALSKKKAKPSEGKPEAESTTD